MNAKPLTAALPLILAAALALTIVSPGAACAQDKTKAKTIKTEGKVRPMEASDANIKNQSVVNDPKAVIPPPRYKEGSVRVAGATKGMQAQTASTQDCHVHIDNQSQWYIQIYMNRQQAGLVGPWGDLWFWVTPGSVRFYGRADLNDSTYIPWGPTDFICGGGETLTWKLYYTP